MTANNIEPHECLPQRGLIDICLLPRRGGAYRLHVAAIIRVCRVTGRKTAEKPQQALPIEEVMHS
jgi:hypothetical protein